MAILCNGKWVDIRYVKRHWAGYVDRVFVVSGDSYDQVYDESVEMGYLD